MKMSSENEIKMKNFRSLTLLMRASKNSLCNATRIPKANASRWETLKFQTAGYGRKSEIKNLDNIVIGMKHNKEIVNFFLLNKSNQGSIK